MSDFQTRKQEYLEGLRKKNGGFKRVLVSPLRYAGGKSKAVGLILDNLPELRHNRVVSCFFGGGSFELCLSQHLGVEVIGYDIFDMLVNFWEVLINRKEEFLEKLSEMIVTKEAFTRNRHILLMYWEKVKPPSLVYNTKKRLELTKEEKTCLDGVDRCVERAVYYYYNMTLSYGPMFLGWPSSNEIKPDKFQRRIEKMRKVDLSNLRVECLDFEEAILKHPDDFIFLDPPYYMDGDSKMFKGMYPNCNFAYHHDGFKHEHLCELLKNHRGGFFITYNDCSDIREWYKEYKQIFPSWQYTYGQGETRIGKNREEASRGRHTEEGNATNIKQSHEIFIICEPLDISDEL